MPQITVDIVDFSSTPTTTIKKNWNHYTGSVIVLEEGLENTTQRYCFGMPDSLVLSTDPEKNNNLIQDFIKLAIMADTRQHMTYVDLQSDAHPTSDVTDPNLSGQKTAIWIGMSLYIGQTSDRKIRLPVFLVSEDIGCGLSKYPVVDNNGNILTDANVDIQLLGLNIVNVSQCVLRRGRAVENGTHDKFGQWTPERMNDILDKTIEFSIPTESEIFFENIYKVAQILGLSQFITIPFHEIERLKAISLAREFILPFLGSTGSNGNHFIEFLRDLNGYIFCVVHSGSRRLGAIAHTAMEKKFNMINGRWAQACSLEHIEMATLIYDTLNQFALINRTMCYIMIINELTEFNISHDHNIIFNAYSNYVRSNLGIDANDKDIKSLCHGIIHNGITGILSECGLFATIVVKKGSIVSGQGTITLVANDCGCEKASCTLIVNTHERTTSEMPLNELYARVQKGITTLVPLSHPSMEGNISLPHGAGRSQSANATSKQITFSDIISQAKNMTAWSVSPDTAGDFPKIAYKNQDMDSGPYNEVFIQKHPLRNFSNFKEGINPAYIKTYIGFINELYEYLSDRIPVYTDHLKMKTPYNEMPPNIQEMYKLLVFFDLILVKSHKETKNNNEYNVLCQLKYLTQQHLNKKHVTNGLIA